jgi:NADPH:quinone reductase-like Zn-dependent oxidoreductase
MRAVRFDRYGPPEVLRVEEIGRPVPKDDEILVKVHAATVNRSDCGFRGADPFISRAFTGLRRPSPDRRTPGMEFSGVVVEVGPAVRHFAVGDEVFGVRGAGAQAEYVRIAETRGVAHKPAGLPWEEAAALGDGPSIALTCLRRAGLGPGKRIVVHGASGSIGTAAVQIAKSYGAHVTAVCNGKSVELVRSLGADEVVDYEREDFTKNGQTYDVIFDAVGKHSFRRCRGSLVPGGLFLETDLGFMWHVPPLILLTKWIGSKRVILPIPKYSKEDVLFVKQLVEEGKYRPVIDRTYPLDDVVEATRYVETGQKTGNVILTLNGGTR